MTGIEAFAALLREVTRRAQSAIAGELGVSEPTLSRWIRSSVPPRGANLSRLVSWAEALPPYVAPPAALPPVNVPADYWRGVYYAAEIMSETIARLLREARQTSEPAATTAAPPQYDARALAALANVDNPLIPRAPARLSPVRRRNTGTG
jgi:transcriptional regulator with XRE-family HTH domain